MNRQRPSLDIYYPIRSIGAGKINVLKQELVEDVGNELPVTPKLLNKLFQPGRLLRAEVLIHSELLQFYDRIGLGEVDEGHIDDLSAYLDEVLPDTSREGAGDTPTLPTRRDPLGEGYVLSIAGSAEVMQTRVLVIAALANYYRLPKVPTDALKDDERVTRAWLVRSTDPLSNSLLERLEVILKRKPELLPDRSILDGVVLRPSPSRNQPQRQ